jgi:very-short-patch-repair endonuclease
MGKLLTYDFIERAKKCHGDKYDYSKSTYYRSLDKLIIICKKHGEFKQTPNMHLNGQGCPKCAIEKRAKEKILKSNGNFQNDAKKCHGDKYDYSLVNYVNYKNKIKIICPKHGVFEQTPDTHLRNHGCPKCSHPSKMLTVKEFIQKSNNIHGNVYDYSLVEYIGAHEKVKIICKKHGEFLQKPNAHLDGQGCPVCNNSKGEEKIIQFLKENNINFEYQKSFDNCKNKYKLFFDFYLPKKNMLIEYDGEQHYRAFNYFGGDLKFKKTIANDKVKTEYAIKNNYRLLRIPYTERNNLSEILKNNIITI